MDTNQAHLSYLKTKVGQESQVLMIGSSMVERFTTTGAAFVADLQDRFKVALAGVGGDGIEHMVYRIHHGLLDDFKGRDVIIMAGTNNIERRTASQVAEGVQYLVDMVLARRSDARVFVLGMLPRDMQKPKKKFGHADLMERIGELNRLLEDVKGSTGYYYFGDCFQADNGLKDDAYYDDHVHLNEAGYRLFYEHLCRVVSESPQNKHQWLPEGSRGSWGRCVVICQGNARQRAIPLKENHPMIAPPYRIWSDDFNKHLFGIRELVEMLD